MLSTKNKLAVLKTLVSVALFAGAIGTAPFAYASSLAPSSSSSCEQIGYDLSDAIVGASLYDVSNDVILSGGHGTAEGYAWMGAGTGFICDGQGFGNDFGFTTTSDFPPGNYAVVLSSGPGHDTYTAAISDPGYVSSLLFTISSPSLTSNILGSTTAAALLVGATGDIGSFLQGIVPYILGILIALLALGMGFRYVRKYVSGRKF